MNTKTFHFELKVKEGDSGDHALIQTSDTFLAKIIEVKISETQEDETTTENG